MRLSLSRRYAFSASHRLHSRKLSEEENRRVYGKCSNPRGHGHNYTIEIAVTGPIDPATGMVTNLRDLDPFVESQVLEAFDHKYLNEEVPAFRLVVPTTENLCVEIFRRLEKFSGACIERVRVEETSLNSFEYRGEVPGACSHE